MHRRATAYEVVASLPTGETMRLGFTTRPRAAKFLDFAQRHADALLPHLGPDDRTTYSQQDGLKLGAVRVHLSGRTERECASLEGRYQ